MSINYYNIRYHLPDLSTFLYGSLLYYFHPYLLDSFYDFSRSSSDSTSTTTVDITLTIKKRFFFSFGLASLLVEVGRNSSSSGERYRYMATTMRIERYYSSVREDVSLLSPDASALLDRQDYVGFFKACGPTYIRGIRRAQEVVAYFIWQSNNDSNSNHYVDWIKKGRKGGSNPTSTSTKFNSESQSTTIIIKGWGLGLTQEGSETLLATSLDQYEEAMKFAFKSMTSIKDSVHIGMVYGMEVIPWVENTSFQVRSQVNDRVIQIPVIRSMIPYAGDNNCNEGFEKDKYKYCCEAQSLYDPVNRVYDPVNPSDKICRPLRTLDPSMLKINLAANGEFIARLDRSLRLKLNQMSTLEKCISVSRAISEKYDFNILKGDDQVKIDGTEINFSLFELKMAIDPFNDYSLLTHMAMELDEWLEMFIQPCYAEIFGTNVGSTSETDPSYIMAYPWHTHETCTKLSCLGNSVRWDRDNGGCVASLIAGSNAKEFDLQTDSQKCAQSYDTSNNLNCKHGGVEMSNRFDMVTTCWKEVIPSGQVDFFLDSYCMPRLTEEQLTVEAQQKLIENSLKGCSQGKTITRNVALRRPVTHSSYKKNYETTKGNDGITNSLHNVAIAGLDSNGGSWWQVDLDGTYKVKEIILHNRGDCCFSDILKNQVEVLGASDSVLKTYSLGSDALAKHTIEVDFTYDVQKVKLSTATAGYEVAFTEVEVMAYIDAAPWHQGKIYNGQRIYSSDYKNYLTLNDEGNLELHQDILTTPTPTPIKLSDVLNHSNYVSTNGLGYAEMAYDGNLKIVDGKGNSLFTATLTGAAVEGSWLYVEDGSSGNVKIYDTKSTSGTELYSSS